MNLPTIENVDVSGKRVFVRTDIDVPLVDGKIGDESRLEAVWPTIEYLLDKGAGVIVAGHIGRPDGKVVPELSTRVVAEWFLVKSQKSKVKSQNENENSGLTEVTLVGNMEAFLVTDRLLILENLRFNPGEENNDPDFAKKLSELAEIYVNESFASVERTHASVVNVPKHLPHYAGLRLAKEIETLDNIVSSPNRPMLVIIGGAKMETKIPVISKMSQVSDDVIVGGKLLQEVGDTNFSSKVHLLDLTVTGFDVIQSSIDRYINLINNAKTIVWNGPMGKVEDFTYQVGTRRLAELVAASVAYKIVGGGDTISFLDKLGLIDKFDWVSTGGGSMLKFLSGENLPGVEALLK